MNALEQRVRISRDDANLLEKLKTHEGLNAVKAYKHALSIAPEQNNKTNIGSIERTDRSHQKSSEVNVELPMDFLPKEDITADDVTLSNGEWEHLEDPMASLRISSQVNEEVGLKEFRRLARAQRLSVSMTVGDEGEQSFHQPITQQMWLSFKYGTIFGKTLSNPSEDVFKHQEALIKNLTLALRRVSVELNRKDPENHLPQDAFDYLNNHGLI